MMLPYRARWLRAIAVMLLLGASPAMANEPAEAAAEPPTPPAEGPTNTPAEAAATADAPPAVAPTAESAKAEAATAEAATAEAATAEAPATADTKTPAAPTPAAMAPMGPHDVKTVKDEGGWRLMVDGEPLMVFGMNWDYIPIGKNYAWVLWHQPDDVIEEALRGEMALLKAMGVNAIRQYPDIPPKWVTWIYENYGIYTVVNHTVGRYGFLVNGTWIGNTDYADPATRQAIIEDIDRMVETYRGTRGVLMYLLGNENNYGLTWTSFEAENLPAGEADNAKAEPLYSLFGEVASHIKQKDATWPIALANGDLGYMDLIAKHGKDIDIMGSNVYRGSSSRDLFDRVDVELDKPFLYSEFGADAYDAKRGREAPNPQAMYLRDQWQEIYEHSHGKGRSGTAIGGLIFQWSDGWWKHGQSVRLDVQDNTASWATGAYPHDHVEGQNNMNEEWFGIAAKDFPDDRGVHTVRPRTAYYLLREAFTLDPYAESTTIERIREHFGELDPITYEAAYRADKAAARSLENAKVRVTRLELRLEQSFSAGDARTERSEDVIADHTESAYFDVTAEPMAGVKSRVSLNVVGNVAQNRLHDIYYENRGRDLTARAADGNGEVDLSGLERVALYQAELEIDQPWFRLEGFYRTGHYHWGDEGDFFGLYPEANYGPNLDIYNGQAPLGAEVTGRKGLEGLKVAFGPELYWGANPGFIAKYHRDMGGFEFALVHREDLGQAATTESSLVVPQRQTRKTSLNFGFETGGLRVDLGALMAGSDRVGEGFRWAEEINGRGYRDTGKAVYDDEIAWVDTLGAKARVTLKSGRYMGYVHGVAKGLVSDAGPDLRKRFTGWSLDESGQGNQVGGLAGFAVNMGSFQIAPHALYQKPLIGPMDPEAPYFSRETGIYYPALAARNQLDDPFAVLSNRETLGLELLFVYDPTPGTWFWEWDNDVREDANFAASLDVVYRHQPTTRDATFGVNDQGIFFAFGGAPPAEDLWDVTLRWVANPTARLRLVGHLFAGHAQANGDSARSIDRFGGDVLALMAPLRVELRAAFDDWGPYDFHRDFNLTYPFQGLADLSYVIGVTGLDEARVRIGLRGRARTLDQYSAEFVAHPDDPDARGFEWEIGSYIWTNL